MDLQALLEEHHGRTLDALRLLDLGPVAAFSEILLEARRKGRTIFFFGNGGSAALANHLAEDLAKGTLMDLGCEDRFRAVSLSANVPFITAYANDTGYENVFVEQLKTYASAGDVAVGISGSGRSPNVLRAVEWANGKGLVTVGITGFDGGELKGLVGCSVHVPVDDMAVSETVHLAIAHMVTDALRRLVGDSPREGQKG